MDLGFVILLPKGRDRNDIGLKVDSGGNCIYRIRHDSRGLSNVVVVMLSLVILVIVVVNVVISAYQMNEFDLERMHENVKITGVAYVDGFSPWFTAQSEFTVDAGSRVNGTYIETESINGSYESFSTSLGAEGNQSNNRLEIDGSFAIDTSAYPLSNVQTVEILMNYKSSDAGENWYLEAYNWTSSTFSDLGFNSTSGNPPSTAWDNYALNMTDQWNNYVQNNGTVYVKILDMGAATNQTTIDVDFIGVRVMTEFASFTFENDGSFTAHLVDLWIDNSSLHERYDMSLFINAGDTVSYSRADVNLPEKPYTVKIITERGNVAVYSPS